MISSRCYDCGRAGLFGRPPALLRPKNTQCLWLNTARMS
jgi:hypothetical protein